MTSLPRLFTNSVAWRTSAVSTPLAIQSSMTSTSPFTSLSTKFCTRSSTQMTSCPTYATLRRVLILFLLRPTHSWLRMLSSKVSVKTDYTPRPELDPSVHQSQIKSCLSSIVSLKTASRASELAVSLQQKREIDLLNNSKTRGACQSIVMALCLLKTLEVFTTVTQPQDLQDIFLLAILCRISTTKLL